MTFLQNFDRENDKFEKWYQTCGTIKISPILYCLDTRLIIVLFGNMDSSIKK